jgi:flagellar hook assembly protein FlgD
VCGTNAAIDPVTRIWPNTISNIGFVKTYLDQAVDSGDYVVWFSAGSVAWNRLHPDNTIALARTGIDVSLLGSRVMPGDPFIAIGRKDVPGYSAPSFLTNPNDTIPADLEELFASVQLPIWRQEGEVMSSMIGPASIWGNASNQFMPFDSPQDSVKLDLLGITPQGNAVVLKQNLQHTANYDLSDISANAYPYLRFRAKMYDTGKSTPPQLKKWQVIYEEKPETVILFDGPTADFSQPLVFGEGEEVTFKFKVENISTVDFKSPMLIKYTLRLGNGSVISGFDTLAALPKGSVLPYEFKLNTLGKPGVHQLTVFANPLLLPERYYDNNVLQRDFTVRPDQANPLLDVTFDGRRILEGDIVSPTPSIGIRLTDENPYYTLSDTATLMLSIRKPGSQVFEEIPSRNNPLVTWSSTGENDLRVQYTPEKLPDGKYVLRVQAKDASGNQAGTVPYQIGFEVINASQITNFYPYPNPFSTSVRFVFTLTGEIIPDEIRIQIMTVTGKVVREISQEELGNVRIGNNISEYAWDGKDEFGDQLANGVYLYRVVVKNQGKVLEQRATAQDALFKNGFGKMYLLK